MPYCSKCGSPMDAEAAFCRQCGTKVSDVKLPTVSNETAVTSPIALQEKTRTETLEEMNRMIKHFKSVEALYDEYDELVKKLPYIKNPRNRIKYKGLEVSSKFFIPGSILLPWGGSLFFLAYIYGSMGESTAAGWLVFIGAVFAVIGIFLLVKGSDIKENNRSLMQEQRAALIKETEKRFSEVTEALATNYQNYGYCAVGQSYTNPKILEKIQSIISLGRADTIKEAINVMHQDAHNSEMELQAKLAASSAASAARGANTAAFFTAADFFLK